MESLAAAGQGARRAVRHHLRWPVVRRVLTVAFVLLVVGLLASHVQTIQWDQVLVALRGYHVSTLALAGTLAAASYLVYSSFDLLGRAYTRHAIARRHVMAITFVSYAFNLNLGAWIGGIGFRYHLYGRRGLEAGRITRILGLSLVTNWLGYLALAGTAMTMKWFPALPNWPLGAVAMQGAGVLLLAITAAYLLLCKYSRRRSWRFRSVRIVLPPVRIAIAQLVVSVLNWLLIASVIYVLLKGEPAFTTVMAVLLLGSIAGVVTHIPGGLGVIEAVFLGFLGGTLPGSQILAAIFAYRAVYYLVPLLLAVVVYLAIARSRRRTPGPAAAART